MTPLAPDPGDLLTEVLRREHGRVLSVLIRDLGDFDLAEDALADAVLQAVDTWATGELPSNPAAWLLTVARRRGIDRLRRSAAGRRAVARLAPTLDPQEEDATDTSTIPDERLRLLFTCCHPALSFPARVALTLRTVAGLSTAQIARAFLVTEVAMERRLVRARRKIRDAGIPYRVPADHDLPDRLRDVLRVVELVFNEAYLATAGDRLVHVDLAREAIHLAGTLCVLMPDEAEATGLHALLRLQHARAATRTDADGRLVTLEHQDRSRWDHDTIRTATDDLGRALARRTPGPYQVQAAIASLHANAPTWEATDWPQIAALYEALHRFRPTPVVALNGAVAVAMAEGPAVGLTLLDDLDEALAGYHLLHVARAELSLRAGRHGDALVAFDRALDLVTNDAERDHLRRRRRSADT